jgi:hypothetical protein
LVVLVLLLIVSPWFPCIARHVLQVAGTLQGLMPGDLGDLGAASWPLDKAIRLLGILTLTGNMKSGNSSQGSNDVNTAKLELIARVMACAQRLYLSAAAWSKSEDPTQELISFIEDSAHVDDFLRPQTGNTDEDSYPSAVVAKSPFVDLILRRLYRLAPGSPNLESAPSGESQEESELSGLSDPLLVHLAQNDDNVRTNSEDLVKLLQIVSACAEAFPSGSCWMTQTQRWCELGPVDDDLDEDMIQINAGTPDDLAVVVHVVANILELHGGHTGDHDTRRWTLLCLLRFTEASAIQSYLSRDAPREFASLRLAWRRVWTTILRSDLGYAALTKTAAAGSNGELVLLLLTELARQFCMDPELRWSNSFPSRQASFLFHRQIDIWSLPVFAKDGLVEIPSPLELVVAVLFSVGLSDQGKDMMGDALPGGEPEKRTSLHSTRRYRLLSVCLRVLHVSGREKVIGAAMTCIAALVHGKFSAQSSIFSASGFELSHDDLTISRVPRHSPYSCTPLESIQNYEFNPPSFPDWLWTRPLMDRLYRHLRISGKIMDDVVAVARSRLLCTLLSRGRTLVSADFVPRSHSDFLFDIMRPLLSSHIEAGNPRAGVPESGGSGTDEVVSPFRNRGPSLSSQILSLKVVLSGILSCRKDLVSVELERVSSAISNLFRLIASELPLLCSNRQEFSVVISNLLRIIRALVEVASETGADWPAPLLESASLVFDACADLLDGYVVGCSEEVVSVDSPGGVGGAKANDFLDGDDDEADVCTLLEDDDSDAEIGGEERRKRKRSGNQSKRSRIKLSETPKGCPSPHCAFLVASVLIALDPSTSVCELVAKALLGVNEVVERSDFDQEVDLLGGLHAALMISTESVMLQGTAIRRLSDASPTRRSPVPLLCQVIEAVRCTAGPESGLHLFGYTLCIDIVRLGENRYRDVSLNSAEAKTIADILKGPHSNQDQRIISNRPHLRAEKLRAAVFGFRNGKDKFHEQIDRDFPRVFVLPSLSDINIMVRRQASLAVAAAMRILPEDKVVESVEKRLPPIAKSQAERDTRKAYRQWYAGKIVEPGTDVAPTADNQAWEDAFQSIEWGVFDCFVRVAGTASNYKVCGKVLFDLVWLSFVRQDLEALSFQAVHKVAALRGATVEYMIEYESEELVRKWLETGESLFNLPLLLTAPTALRRILQAGNYNIVTQEGSAGSILDMSRFRETAALEFMVRHCHSILPRILALSMSRLLESSLTKDGRRSVLEDPFIKELCSAFSDRYNDDVAKNILRIHIPNILAFCAKLHCGSKADQRISTEIEKLLEGLLSKDVIQLRSVRDAHLALRRVLELSGKRAHRESIKSFTEAVKAIVARFGGPESTGRELFARVGSSTTECLLSGKLWLTNGLLESQLDQRWSTIRIVCDLVVVQLQANSANDLQIGFCLHTLSDVLLNPALEVVHCRALDTIMEVLIATVHLCTSSDSIRTEVAKFATELLAVCMHVHERGQKKLLDTCTDASGERGRVLKQSLGVLGVRRPESTGAWGWEGGAADAAFSDERASLMAALQEYRGFVKKSTLDIVTGTYKVLQFVLENASSIGLQTDAYVGVSPPYEVDASHSDILCQIDPTLSAQSLMRDFLEHEHSSSDPGTKGTSLFEPVILKRLRMKNDNESGVDSESTAVRCHRETNSGDSFSIDQRLMRAELVELQQFLSQLRTQAYQVGGPRLEMNEIGLLVREITAHCGLDYSEQVQLAASSCLGEIDVDALHSHVASELVAEPSKDWIDCAITSKRLLRTLQARSIEVLGGCLKSQNVKVSMVAMETLKALLKSRDGVECQNLLLHTNMTTMSTLGAILSDGRLHRGDPLHLTEKEISEIKDTSNVAAMAPDAQDWCWDNRLWSRTSGEKMSFEEWICCLVPALLVCCYGDTCSDGSKRAESNEFFTLCQRISRFEPSFAVALFPAIVLDLLQNSSPGERGTGKEQDALTDTWVGLPSDPFNAHLSRAFTSLLSDCGPSEGQGERRHFGDLRHIDLAADTLDLLRRLTQNRFLESREHQRNPTTVGDVRTAEDRKAEKPSQDVSSTPSDSDLGDAPPWRGLPFGVVLRIDGLLIAQACIRVRRFATAIFYAEMYADARFGHSSGVLEATTDVLTNGAVVTCSPGTGDISGFNLAIAGTTLIQDDALAFTTLLRKSFVALGEEEARRAIDQQSADLRLAANNISNGVFSFEGELSPSLHDLQLVDNMACLERRSRPPMLAMVDCLDRLGLRNTLQMYIGGLNADNSSVFREDDSAVLRDKWFECCLYDMQWDDDLFRGEKNDSKRLADGDAIGSASLHGSGNEAGCVQGFHESTVKAMVALTRGDTELCAFRLTAARRQVLKRMSSLAGGEILVSSTVEVVDSLQALNDLDGLFSKADSLKDTLSRWNLCGTSADDAERGERVVLTDSTGHSMASCHDFSNCVREITLRALCVNSSKSATEGDSGGFQYLVNHLWRVCSVNCHLGRHNVAEAALQRLYRILKCREGMPDGASDSLTVFRLRLKEASLLESKGNFTGAIRLVKQTIKHIPAEIISVERDSLMADALVTCGRWMTKHKIEPANSVLDNYLKRGSSIALTAYDKEKTTATAHSATEAFLAIGEVASNLFEAVAARVKSHEWQKGGKSIADRESELKDCDKLIEETKKRQETTKKRKAQSKEATDVDIEMKEVQYYRFELQREVTNAKRERGKIQCSVEKYRSLALQSFVSALSIADVRGPNDMLRHVYRMISIWFSSNTEDGKGEEVDSTIADAVIQIPSFRFVPLASQLFSRLDFDDSSSGNGAFQERLRRLLFKMSLDHPYHSIIHLITLSNGKKVSGRHANAFLENTNTTKVDRARDMLGSLKNEDPIFLGPLIESFEVLAEAYIHLTMVDTSNIPKNKTSIHFSTVRTSGGGQRLDQCLGTGSRRVSCTPCILTKLPTLRPGCDYGGGKEDPPGTERIVGFDNHFSMTDGGIHRPKIVVCLGSKGGRFKQLVKGEDDIRQDAVMEQVFGCVNELMTRQDYRQGEMEGADGQGKASTSKPLKLVTYSIVPLSPASGVSNVPCFIVCSGLIPLTQAALLQVLEWVDNTIPFGDYIIDKGSKSSRKVGAQSKYFPGEWGSSLCSKQLKNAPQGEKRSAYDDICVHHSPVFRYFFVERFGNSLEAWHSAKMRYARSVAVNSIVGHVLGIGDRHGSNILVHERTGEVVHIDFGFVFEQGKVRNPGAVYPHIVSRTSHMLFLTIINSPAINYTRESTISVDTKHCRRNGTDGY